MKGIRRPEGLAWNVRNNGIAADCSGAERRTGFYSPSGDANPSFSRSAPHDHPKPQSKQVVNCQSPRGGGCPRDPLTRPARSRNEGIDRSIDRKSPNFSSGASGTCGLPYEDVLLGLSCQAYISGACDGGARIDKIGEEANRNRRNRRRREAMSSLIDLQQGVAVNIYTVHMSKLKGDLYYRGSYNCLGAAKAPAPAVPRVTLSATSGARRGAPPAFHTVAGRQTRGSERRGAASGVEAGRVFFAFVGFAPFYLTLSRVPAVIVHGPWPGRESAYDGGLRLASSSSS